MKKIILIALSSLIAFCSMAQLASAKGLDNLRNPKIAMEIAKKDGKVLMYHFTGSSWCPPCKQLEANVFADRKFESYAKKNIAYVNMDNAKGGFIDKEYDAEYKQLMAKYNVRGFPTLILINPKNGKTESIVGYNGAPTSDIIKKIEAFKKAK